MCEFFEKKNLNEKGEWGCQKFEFLGELTLYGVKNFFWGGEVDHLGKITTLAVDFISDLYLKLYTILQFIYFLCHFSSKFSRFSISDQYFDSSLPRNSCNR